MRVPYIVVGRRSRGAGDQGRPVVARHGRRPRGDAARGLHRASGGRGRPAQLPATPWPALRRPLPRPRERAKPRPSAPQRPALRWSLLTPRAAILRPEGARRALLATAPSATLAGAAARRVHSCMRGTPRLLRHQDTVAALGARRAAGRIAPTRAQGGRGTSHGDETLRPATGPAGAADPNQPAHPRPRGPRDRGRRRDARRDADAGSPAQAPRSEASTWSR
jgi:hypothetical protein